MKSALCVTVVLRRAFVFYCLLANGKSRCVYRFRHQGTKNTGDRFFLRYGSGKPVLNINKEFDSLQREFGLPQICSSNARHVIETLKGTAGLDPSSSAGITNL